MVRARLRILMVLLTLPVLAIVGRLWSLQLDPDSHHALSGRAVHPALRLVEPSRGAIVGSDGGVIAENVAVFDLEFSWRGLNPRSVVLEVVAQELGRDGDFPSAREIDKHLRALVDLAELERQWILRRRREGEGPARVLLVEQISPRAARRIRRRLANVEVFQRAFALLRDDGGPEDEERGVWSLWLDPFEALDMERTLLRLARRLPAVSFADLEARVDEALATIDRWVAHFEAKDRAAGVDEAIVRQKARNSRLAYYADAWLLAEDVGLDVVTDVEYHADLYPGVTARDSSKRHYPLGEAAGALVGYLRELRSGEIEALEERGQLLNRFRSIRSAEAFEVVREEALLRDDLVGAGGLEAKYDERLRGAYGMRVVQVDVHGEPREVLSSLPAATGDDLVTTIDTRLQSTLYRELASTCNAMGPVAGSIVVLEIPGGEVRASVGFPSFDPNRVREPGYLTGLEKHWGRQTTGWLLDRPRHHALYPGSIFKIVTAVAALESGRAWNEHPVDPLHSYACTHSYEFNDKLHCASSGGHGLSGGLVNLYDAFKFSCNTYFYYLADKHLEPPLLWHWARNLGFGQATGIDLPRHGGGLDKGRLSPPDRVLGVAGSCHLGIGQVHIEATPLQVARLLGAIAVDAKFVPTPWIVDAADPTPLRLDKPRTASIVREGLERVLEPGGTAHGEDHAHLEDFDIAAKTGTAQFSNSDRRYHAWIAGYGPVVDPRYVFVVSLEKSLGGGGATCSPVLRSVLEELAVHEPRLRRGSGATGDTGREEER